MPAPEPPARFLTVDGMRIAYDERGHGEPFVLLHGYPQSHEAWRHQLDPLGQAHRAIAVSLPGWGASERDLTRPTGYESDLATLGRILDVLGIESCTLAGHDYGGHLALGFALRHPSRVRRLALLNSRAHRTFPGVRYLATWLTARAARTLVVRRLLEMLPVAAVHRLGMRAPRRAGVFDAALVERYVGWMGSRPGSRWWARFFASYQVAEREELRKGLSRISCPVGIVWTKEDPWCPVSIARELEREIPGAALTLLDGGHFVMEEAPEAVTAALLALLSRPPTGD